MFTADATIEGIRRGRNALREKLWTDPVFAHMYMVHYAFGEQTCPDGCDGKPHPRALGLYQTPMELG